MRIITGIYRGRVLTTLPDKRVRPVTDKVKGTIFNVLQSRLDLREAHVLDMFAGSGSLGLEAISREAADAVFVDEDHEVLDTIERNAGTLGCLDQCVLVQSDAQAFIDRTQDTFDLIFADPPYAYGHVALLPGLILRRQLLKKEGFLIIEHEKRVQFPEDPAYHIAVQKEFGNTRVSFFALGLKKS
ncbi:MAG TPA: 16S rRNA (guanine(966)-N(2))-methyltransferase RsmD [Bacteroidota bacterium]|nr:16S rRNA (guanine(966)-N(2))-methyltransferase RsmD [Bacteroidota bacterium]